MVDESVKYYQASDLAKRLVTELKDAVGNEAATTNAEESLLVYIARLEKRIKWLESGDSEEY